MFQSHFNKSNDGIITVDFFDYFGTTRSNASICDDTFCYFDNGDDNEGCPLPKTVA